jgi:predicted unusual protein kinase regulating ubiquinone biosynthesis (AarF/ABC1/UbiB family)
MRKWPWVLAAGAGAAAVIVARARDARTVMTTGVAGRNARLAAVGAKSGAAYAVHRARRAVATPEQRVALDEEHQLRTAAQVAETLGHMKGALMKVGQMASYLDEGMPEPVREALASLQQDAPPMAPELCAEVVRAELGTDPERVFAEWNPVPIAAASIGQVHRARTHEGDEVAVKVQYPGVDEAIRADLASGDMLFRALSMMFPGLEAGPLVEELRARLVEELDYTIEAHNQRLFGRYYTRHPYIHIPRVFDSLSTSRVLTTEFADGARFAEVEHWSQAERDAAAETIYRFVFRSIYRLHAFNGDPHPGNYLFKPGGQVTFLDFGLVKHYTREEVRIFEDLIRTLVLENDIVAYRRVLENANILLPDAPITDDEVQAYFGHFYEFVMKDEVVTFSDEYASESVRKIFDLQRNHEVTRYSNVPPMLLISQRINLGLHAVLARLHATANFRKIAEELWPMVDGPPTTPMGEAEHAWLASRA